MATTTQFEVSAELRSDVGKGASRRLRRLENKIPAVIYGADKPSIAISLNHFHISKALENEAFYSHILTLDINGEKQQAVLKDMQRHPYKPRILHMDFLRINPKEEITMHVPLHFMGAELAPGVKDNGIVTHLLNNVEIRCLPANLPEFIEVDISQLELDQMLHLTDLKLPKDVELVALAHGDSESHNAAVVKIQLPRIINESESTSSTADAEVPAGAVPATVGHGTATAAASGKESKEDSKK